jgi:glucose/arabinose dehydrogenase
MFIARSLPVLALAVIASPLALAQREVPFRMGIPVAPSGLADKPLGNGPFDYATGEGQNIRVTVLTKALSFPFTLTFLPDGTMLITQRDGKLRVMRDGKLDPNPGAGGPTSFSTGS